MTAYEAVPHPTLRQGDIILAPSAVLVAPEQQAEVDLHVFPVTTNVRIRRLGQGPGAVFSRW